MEAQGRANPTKRARLSASDSGEDGNGNAPRGKDGKKQRGRPKIDTQDATAADRRRTQIRLAQRAYRQRKEATIGTLKAQVSSLQSSIESMNAAFLRFHDAAHASGVYQLRPQLAAEMKEVTEIFVRCAKDSSNLGSEDGGEFQREGSHESGVDEEIARDPPAPERTQSSQAELMEAANNPGWNIPYSTRGTWLQVDESNAFETVAAWQSGTLALSQDNRPQPTQTQLQALSASSYDAPPPSRVASGAGVLPFGLVDPSEDYSSGQSGSVSRIPTPGVPTPTPTGTLESNVTRSWTTPPWTFSVDELTFSRRLTRAALEKGYHALSMPQDQHHPNLYNHVFKLSLLYQTRDQILDKFRAVLARGPQESLDFWAVPFIHLGGAGTHYPRRDPLNRVISSFGAVDTNFMSRNKIRSAGPWPVRAILEASDPAVARRAKDLDFSAFEGEWFDSGDVEGYLEEKGVKINPQASFVEVDVGVVERLNRTDSNVTDLEQIEEMDLDGFLWHRQWSPSSGSLNSNAENTSGRTKSSSMPSAPLTPPSANAQHEFGRLASHGSHDNPGAIFDQNFDQNVNIDLSTFNDTNHDSVDGLTNFANQDLPIPLSDLNDPILMSVLDPFAGMSKASDFSTLDADALAGLDSMTGFTTIGNNLSTYRSQTVTVDVAKLINKLINRSVCLGRSPGFRRTDVNQAFHEAIIQA